MAMHEFKSYKEWMAAVKHRGLETEHFVDVENGPSSEDPYEPVWAVKYLEGHSKHDHKADEFGLFQFKDGDHDLAILFDTPEEFTAWYHKTMHEEPPEMQESSCFGLMRDLLEYGDKFAARKVYSKGQKVKIPEDFGGEGVVVRTGTRYGIDVVFVHVPDAEGDLPIPREEIDKLNEALDLKASEQWDYERKDPSYDRNPTLVYRGEGPNLTIVRNKEHKIFQVIETDDKGEVLDDKKHMDGWNLKTAREVMDFLKKNHHINIDYDTMSQLVESKKA